MQNQKRRSLETVALLIAVLSAGSLFAKGPEQRLAGTVKSIGQDYVIIETKARQTLNVKITSATKFLNGNTSSSPSEMKIGDHVRVPRHTLNRYNIVGYAFGS